jgi:hypothetical protein
MRKFTIALILCLASVSCQLSAATVNKNPSYLQIDAKVFTQSNTHPYRVDVIAPDVIGGKVTR